jgi:release factor glutamine methyltransferase
MIRLERGAVPTSDTGAIARYEDRQRVIQRHRASDRPDSFTLLGREWDLLPEVYAPVFAFSTTLFTQWIPYPVGGRMLEMGSGAGVTAVTAALSGCAEVVALDINPAAVANTRRNAERHRVADRVECRQSDLFAALGPAETFDLVFWNSNFVDVPADIAYTSDLDRAFFDPGYECHERFIAGARGHLRAGGRLLLGFSDLGNRERLEQIADRHGWRVATRTEERRTTSRGDSVNLQLLEFTSTGSAAA